MELYVICFGGRSGYDLYRLPVIEEIKAGYYSGGWTCNRDDATYFTSVERVYEVCLLIGGKVRRDSILVITQDVERMAILTTELEAFNGMGIIKDYNKTSNGFLMFDFKEGYSKHVRPIDMFETAEIMGYLSRKGVVEGYTLAEFRKKFVEESNVPIK